MSKTLVLVLMYQQVLVLDLHETWSWFKARPRPRLTNHPPPSKFRCFYQVLVESKTETNTLFFVANPECLLKCIFKWSPSGKALGHWLQGNGFSSVCVLKCIFKYSPFEKILGHWLQGNSFSSECVLKCIFKSPPFEKALGHRLQGNCFSPECVLKCVFICPLSEKALGHQ